MAREAEKRHGDDGVRGLARGVSAETAEQHAGYDASHFGDLILRGAAGEVARGDVRNLMCHRGRELILFIGNLDQAGVYENVAAGQREGVEAVVFDDFERERNLGVGIARQVLSHAIDEFGNERVVDDLGLARDFGSELLAERHFLLDRIQVEALADVTVADQIGVALLALGVVAGEGGRGEKGGGQDEGETRSHGASSGAHFVL